MKLPHQVQRTMERVDAMSLRERALLLGALVAVLFLAWDSFLMQQLNALHDARAGQFESLQQQVNDLNRAIQDSVSAEALDPDTAARRQLAELRVELVDVDRRIESHTGDLVAPSQMGRVLERLLERTGGLVLVSMRNLDVERLDGGLQGAAFFRHGIELEVAGNFHTVLDYLKAVEGFEWRFVWGSVDLVVDDPPRNHTRIVLYTLSLGEGLLGV